MGKSNAKYSKSISKCIVPESLIVEEWELQYDENHNVDKVKVGETDLVKEVESHKDEVGLINAIKYAIAHGDDPLTKFGKREPGVPFAINPNATFDEVKGMVNETDLKFDEIAKSLGITTDVLKDAIRTGTVGQLIKAASQPSATVEKGSDE